MVYGASGGVMGIMGAYLYLFPHAKINLLCTGIIGGIRNGFIREWPAQGVVAYYIFYMIVVGLRRALYGQPWVELDYFAHLAGGATGLLMVIALGIHRDTEEISEAQALRHDEQDLGAMRLMDLETLMERPNPEANLVVSYCEKALATGEPRNQEKALQAMLTHSRILIEQGNAPQLAEIVVRLPPDLAQRIPTVFLLRLGSRLERVHANEPAVQMYYMIKDLAPNSPDCEVALYRMGRLAENVYQAPEQARDFYQELLKRFPSGTMALEAQRSLAAIGARASLAAGGNQAG
jgi:hypothetical protein